MTMEFEFGLDVIDRVVKEVEDAKKYIKIAVFQIHNESIYVALEHALTRGIVVEIFTLPYDSINKNIRDTVTDRIERIKANGAKVYFSKWGIGDPERTTTAVGRWYSFHGKFIITDNVAISLSANLTEEPELDAMLIYKDQVKIMEFNEKFEALLTLFEKEGIRDLIEQTEYDGKETLFLAPRTITEPEVKLHWIRDYPSEMCRNITSIENKLYIAPIECKARNFSLNSVIFTWSLYISMASSSGSSVRLADKDIATLSVTKNLP